MATHPSIIPLLRRAAPRLSRHFFALRGCPQQTPRPAQIHLPTAPRPQFKAQRQTVFLHAFRTQSTAAPAGDGFSKLGEGLLGKARSKGKANARPSSYPLTSRRIVAYWLFGSAASVFGIVVFGGLTRLTESGYVESFLSHDHKLTPPQPQHH